MKVLAIIAALALLAGCASRPATIEAEPEPSFKVAYSGGIGDVAQDVLNEPPQYTGPASTEGTPIVRIEARILRLSAGAAEALLGKYAGTVGALALESDAADELLQRVRERNDCSLVSAPVLSVFEGQVGTISVSNDVAYISGYELRSEAPHTRIADPVVSVVQDGILLGVTAAAKVGGWQLELDLSVTELMRPIGRRTIQVFGQPMTVQVPVLMTQRIKGAGKASAGRTLALTGMVGADNHVLLVLVSLAAGE